MKTAQERQPTTRPVRRVLATMYVGLGLTLLAVIVAILADHSGDIARQLRHAYAERSAQLVGDNRSQPPAVDLAGLAPCLAGLVAIILLWTPTTAAQFTKRASHSETGASETPVTSPVHQDRSLQPATRTAPRTESC